MKVETKNGKCGRGLVWLWLACLILVPSVAAQTSNRASVNTSDSDPLHQLNNSIRGLVKRVTPSVVQVLVSGYGPVENSRGTSTSLVIGRQDVIGSGVIIDPDGYIVTNAHVIRALIVCK